MYSLYGSLYSATTELSTAIAIVAHYECSAASPSAAEWIRASVPFDWSRQFFRSRSPTEKRFWAIANSTLAEDGLCIENIVCYPNTACCRVDSQGRVRAHPPLEDIVGVPPTYYFVFTLGDSKARYLVHVMYLYK